MRHYFKATLLSLLLMFGAHAFALDVNKASSTELQTIDGVGPVIAERIIRERSRGGRFASTSDLIERVKGVGEKTAQRITSGSGLKAGTRKTSKRSSSSSSSSKTSSSKGSSNKTASSGKKSTSKKATTKSASADKKTSSKKSAKKKSSTKKSSAKKSSKKKSSKNKSNKKKTSKKKAKKSSGS